MSSASIQVIPYIGLIFASYDFFSRRLANSNIPYIKSTIENNPSTANAIVGAISGIVSKTVVYPLDLVRKRMQIQGPKLTWFATGVSPKSVTIYSTAANIIRREGPLGLFRGLLPSLIKAAPSSAAVFFSFSLAKNFILKHF
ncbi:Mitochondrial thiamine pyrophosphate carrier 1 [Smittium mucronatum]|uniref:Mitochondrial thiamine pyrophosphate carrier 1 n=1 Tax=Smittium mucronatum TaxID=133383 RepID=A0A1R0H4R1_9FUNG|nr:Mitochondrial thiamine pyrophosphate carrier 1 [Smittium mucronatum]